MAEEGGDGREDRVGCPWRGLESAVGGRRQGSHPGALPACSLLLEGSLVEVPWGGDRLVGFRSHRLSWKRGIKAEKYRRDSLPGRRGRAEAGEGGRLGGLGSHEDRRPRDRNGSRSPRAGGWWQEVRRALPQDRLRLAWEPPGLRAGLAASTPCCWARGPRAGPAPLWAPFRCCDSPPGDEAVEPGRGCPALQKPVGLGLLEPRPGLGLQGRAAFLRPLLGLPSILWAGGSPWGLRRCLERENSHDSGASS